MLLLRDVARFGAAVVLAAALGACDRQPPAVSPAVPAALVPAPRATAISVGDWPSHNRDLAGTRFSPLAEVHTDNVAHLIEAWRYPLPRATSAVGEQMPLVIDGVMYVSAGDRVVALDAHNGRERWRQRLEGEGSAQHGVGYWPGDALAPARLFFTAGRRLLAIAAANGEPIRNFGSNGAVEMAVPYHAAPTPFEDLLVVGSSAAPGSVRAYDARSGTEVWAFAAVPPPGAPGHETWESDAWRDQPGVLHTARSVTVDVDRALVYAVFEGPGPDAHFGADRPGDTLFGSAIVALEARTGARRWHFQTVRHDLWGYGLSSPPVLLDLPIGGRTVPALALPTPQGYLFVLNRVTGEPVFAVDQRAVPASATPGERSAPTQPIPLRPPPLARVAYSPADLVTAADTTEEHARYCRELAEQAGGLVNLGPFTPYYRQSTGASSGATVVFPGSTGSVGWGGVAAEPGVGYVFVNTTDIGDIGVLEDPAADASVDGSSEPRDSARNGRGERTRFWWDGRLPGGSEASAGPGWPCQKPPWGRLAAVDVAAGEIVWQVPLGITEQLPARRQRTGRPSIGGPIATAGGLVFIAATDDRRFRAFAARTGEQLWATELEASAHAVPLTYRGANGKQYVAIVVGGSASGAAGPALIAYALP